MFMPLFAIASIACTYHPVGFKCISGSQTKWQEAVLDALLSDRYQYKTWQDFYLHSLFVTKIYSKNTHTLVRQLTISITKLEFSIYYIYYQYTIYFYCHSMWFLLLEARQYRLLRHMLGRLHMIANQVILPAWFHHYTPIRTYIAHSRLVWFYDALIQIRICKSNNSYWSSRCFKEP